MLPSINIFGKEIATYAIIAVIGILFCGYLALKLTKQILNDNNDMLYTLLFSIIGIFLGGHLLYGIINFNLIIELITKCNMVTSVEIFINCIYKIFGGSVFYGGLIGGILVGFIYMKKKKLPIGLYSDIIAPIIPLFHFFGRIGCFLGGCCYGIETSFGFLYENQLIPQASGVIRFPVQLLESLFNIILFLVLMLFFKKGKFKNKLIYIYLLIYSVGRFFIEFLRGDDYRGYIFSLSTSQFIGIIIFLSSATILLF
ncbi:MAG: prolipoprotein diacylglyceryl transferase, partial [Clostridia bacterium]